MEGIETSALTDVQLKAVQDDLGITAAMNAASAANNNAEAAMEEASKGVADAATAQEAAEAAQATADKGVPVDEVTAGNMFPATSNAVNTALIKNVNRIINSEGTAPTNNNADHTIIAGIYVCNPDILGLPVATYGVLSVYGQYTEVPSGARQWIYQDFHTTSGEIYHRCSINGGSLTPDNWTPWDKYVKESNITVANGSVPNVTQNFTNAKVNLGSITALKGMNIITVYVNIRGEKETDGNNFLFLSEREDLSNDVGYLGQWKTDRTLHETSMRVIYNCNITENKTFYIGYSHTGTDCEKTLITRTSIIHV